MVPLLFSFDPVVLLKDVIKVTVFVSGLEAVALKINVRIFKNGSFKLQIILFSTQQQTVTICMTPETWNA